MPDGHDRPCEQVGRPVRRARVPAREQFPGALENDDAVAEQAPALFRMTDDRTGRLAVRAAGIRTRWRVRAHRSASWLVPRCGLDHTLLCQLEHSLRHGPL